MHYCIPSAVVERHLPSSAGCVNVLLVGKECEREKQCGSQHSTAGDGELHSPSSFAPIFKRCFFSHLNACFFSVCGGSAPAWDGKKGGIIAIKATGSVTINGLVDAAGRGFRGAPRGKSRHQAKI